MEFNLINSLLNLTLVGAEWVLWLLILLSVVSVAVILERVLFFSRIRINFPDFSAQLTEKLIAKDYEAAVKLCASSPALESQVALRAFSHRDKGEKAMDESMSGYLFGVRHQLDRGLTVLGTLGNNAPFIGLFGTVIGIIKAFHDLSVNPAGGPSVVMAGISESLVATAVGLMVAIPAVIAFNTFQRIVKRRFANAESIKRLILSNYSK